MYETIIGAAMVVLVGYILKRAYWASFKKMAAEAKAISQDPNRQAPSVKDAFNKVIEEVEKETAKDE